MPKRVKVLLLLLFVAGIGLFTVASFVGGSGNSCGQPDVVDQLIPNCHDSILQNQRVGVDMRAGWTAELTVNGTAIPLDQIQSIGVTANAATGVAPDTFVFQPGPGKALEHLDVQNCAMIRYWSLAAGESTARTYTWCFRAT